MSNIVGKTVNHRIYGKGKVIGADDDRAIIDFSGTKRFFPLPESIKNHYFLIDTGLPEEIVINSKEYQDAEKDEKYYRNLYRLEYKDWIENEYNKNSGKPINDVKGYVSDAFYIEEHCRERNFLSWFDSEDTLEEAREALLKVEDIINGKQNPKTRVSGYIGRMRIFREYLIHIGRIPGNERL